MKAGSYLFEKSKNGPQAVFRGLNHDPACAVCHKVLNLQKQVGNLPGAFALAEAYRVCLVRLVPSW